VPSPHFFVRELATGCRVLGLAVTGDVAAAGIKSRKEDWGWVMGFAAF